MVCYSHFETNAMFDDGANNEGVADVTCKPVEWQYPTVDLGPEAMFFTSDTTGEQFEIWAVSLINIRNPRQISELRLFHCLL